jgi:hypothetical protein
MPIVWETFSPANKPTLNILEVDVKPSEKQLKIHKNLLKLVARFALGPTENLILIL